MKEKDLHLISSIILLSFLFLFSLVNFILYLSNIGEINFVTDPNDFRFITHTLSFSFKIFFASLFLICLFIFIFFFKKSPKKEINFYLINLLTLALNFDVLISSIFFMIDKIHTTNIVPTTVVISLCFIGLSFILVGLSCINKLNKKASLFLVMSSMILVLFSYSLIVIKELDTSEINYIFATKIVLLILQVLVYSFYIVSYLSYDPVYEISIKHNEKYIDKQKAIQNELDELKENYKLGKIEESKYLELKEILEQRMFK